MLQDKSISIPICQNLKVYLEAWLGFSHVSVQMVSTTSHYLKAASLKSPPSAGRVGRTCFPRTGRTWGASNHPDPEPRSISQINWRSCPINDRIHQQLPWSNKGQQFSFSTEVPRETARFHIALLISADASTKACLLLKLERLELKILALAWTSIATEVLICVSSYYWAQCWEQSKCSTHVYITTKSKIWSQFRDVHSQSSHNSGIQLSLWIFIHHLLILQGIGSSLPAQIIHCLISSENSTTGEILSKKVIKCLLQSSSFAPSTDYIK